MKKVILYTSGQITHTRQTGGVRRFLELLNQLPKYVELTFMSGDTSCLSPEGVRHISMNQKRIYDKEWKCAIHNFRYLKKIKKEHYDTLIVFDIPPAIWLALFRIPRITLMIRKDLIGYEKIRFSEIDKSRLKKAIALKMFSLAEIITILHAQKIVVQCKYDKEELKRRHKFFANLIDKKTKIQINNVNPSWAVSFENEGKNKSEESFLVGSVNDFTSKRKGCDIFLEAIAELIDEGIPLKGYIAGDGKLFNDYKEKYRKYTQIYFLGRIKNPSEFVKQMDLTVVPSRADSCPNTVMEALYNDVPVIGTRCGGIPEILKDDKALFAPDIQELKNRILFFMEEKNRNDLINRQKNRKEELCFDWVKKIADLL